jgi:hypothetical protein
VKQNSGAELKIDCDCKKLPLGGCSGSKFCTPYIARYPIKISSIERLLIQIMMPINYTKLMKLQAYFDSMKLFNDA